MTHETFVMAVNKGLENQILAFDDQKDNCVLLVRHEGATIKIMVPDSIINRQKEKTVSALRECLRSKDWTSWTH